MEQQKTIGDYITIQQIGAGSFAVVWKARHRVTGHIVAIKEIVTEKLNKKLQENLISEITILKRANHPNIIKLYDIVKTPSRIYLVLEYCAGGDLAGYLNRHGRVPDIAARNFMQQLGSGLQILRKNDLIHRDLKPQNLLLSTNDHNAVLKIADFGFARSLQPQGMAETLCGSPLYMAPEILLQQKYDAKADLWSVGAILFQLVTGKPPFYGNNHVQLLQNISKSDLAFPSGIEIHADCMDICRRLLRRNPVERLSFEEFFNHPFMRPRARNIEIRAGQESTEAQQEECLPFLLDEDPQGAADFPPKQHTFSSSPQHHRIGLKLLSSPRDDMQDPSMRGQQGTEDSSHTHAATLLDSLECIEREYVLVSTPLISTEALSVSLTATTAALQKAAAGSPQKTFLKPHSPNTHSSSSSSAAAAAALANRISTPPNACEGSEDCGGGSDAALETPSQHPPTRIFSLQRCAHLIAELATDKFDNGQICESLAVQLICLAIWKEALKTCHAWAETQHQQHQQQQQQYQQQLLQQQQRSDDDETAAASACSEVEQEFSVAVDRGEELASHLGSIDGDMEVPNALEIIFQAALTVGRSGAVEELMGNVSNAAVAYTKSVTFLYFLLVEASSLSMNPHLTLTLHDRHRLRRYIDSITDHLTWCRSQQQKHSHS